MARLGVAAFGVMLVTTAAGAQTLGETSAAMGVHNGAAGMAVQRAPVSRDQIRNQLRNSGNPRGSTCPLGILADYGRRVAAEEAAKSGPKGAWVGAGHLGGKTAATGKSWETAHATPRASTGTNAWAKSEKGTATRVARRR